MSHAEKLQKALSDAESDPGLLAALGDPSTPPRPPTRPGWTPRHRQALRAALWGLAIPLFLMTLALLLSVGQPEISPNAEKALAGVASLESDPPATAATGVPTATTTPTPPYSAPLLSK